MVKSTMTETVPSWGRGGTAAMIGRIACMECRDAVYCYRCSQCSRIRLLRFFGVKKRAFWHFFKWRQKVVGKSLVLNPSQWLHILRSVITVIFFMHPATTLRPPTWLWSTSSTVDESVDSTIRFRGESFPVHGLRQYDTIRYEMLF